MSNQPVDIEGIRARLNNILTASDIWITRSHHNKAMGQSIPCCQMHKEIYQAQEDSKSICDEVEQLRADYENSLKAYVELAGIKYVEVEALRARVKELEAKMLTEKKTAWMAGFDYGWNEAFCPEHTCSPSEDEKSKELSLFMSSPIPPPVEPTKGEDV